MNQTVTDDPDLAPRGGEEVGVQDPLESLLSEYDADPSPAEPKEEPNDDIKFIAERLRAQEAKAEEERINADINSAVNTITQSVEDLNVTPRVVEDFIHGEGRRDPRINEAFANRYSKPNDWKQVVNVIADKLRGQYQSQPDPQAAANRQAVAQSVRSASTNAPTEVEQVNTKRFTAAQWEEYMRNYK